MFYNQQQNQQQPPFQQPQNNGNPNQPPPNFMPNIQQSASTMSRDFQKMLAQNLVQQVVNGIVAENHPELLKQAKPNQSEQEKKDGFLHQCCPFLFIEFYQPYFDVQTIEVVSRVRAAVNPFNNSYFQVGNQEQHPDMYGPFWIYTTLIFALTAAGNLSHYLSLPTGSFTYDFSYVPMALGGVYTLGTMIPIILTFVMKMFGTSTVTYLKTINIYGYANVVFIPVCFLCIIPFSLWQWGFMIYATVNTTLFLTMNFNKELDQYIGNRKMVVTCIIAGSQFLLLIFYKVWFFNTMIQSDVKTLINQESLQFGNSTYNSTLNFSNHFQFNHSSFHSHIVHTPHST